jgi:hypothetical protein
MGYEPGFTADDVFDKLWRNQMDRLEVIRRTCKHDKVPFVKSLYGEELVQRGNCPDCGVSLQELD